ncbi:MAG: electron transfer flavoprotein subunit alpha, partial [Deltaproteobacteria bacterium]|nr:electron transfer flavoprotein subunit alpha [Deltaproteobacteria bacterium]
MGVWIEFELCNGCKRCLKVCPYDAIEIQGEKAVILDRCTACGACIEVCRQEAIKSDVAERTIPNFNDYNGVWVLVEQQQGELDPVSLELLGEAQQLALTLGQTVGAILPGKDIANLTEILASYGAEKIYLADHEQLASYQTEVYAEVIADLVALYKPDILLIGATSRGRDLAPRLARRLKTGLTADCTALTIDPDEKILLQTRPAFGGNIMATIACRYSRPQMATVRPGVMQPCKREIEKPVEIIKHNVKPVEKAAVTILEAIREARKKVRLGEAKIIIAGGRGTGGEMGFKLIEKLAEEFGGEVAGTRIAVEEGWVPVERQVGQTGQSVRPELYIACGISGAVQHRAGMQNSRYIIAINKDPGAP